MTNNGQRTIDIDSNQQVRRQRHIMEASQANLRAVADTNSVNNSKTSFPPARSQRRLHKWVDDKTDELNSAAEDDEDDGMSDPDHDETGPLVQSLSAMASHLMNSKHGENDNIENSSEKDVYITEKGHGVTVSSDDQDSEEETASEEDSTDSDIQSERKRGSGGDMNDVGGGEDDNDDDNISPKLKSDHYSTTPKGLTTWSAVNGHTQSSYSSKVTMQKTRPVEYTISSVLSFSTERPQTTQEMVVIKERETTTEPGSRATAKVNLVSPSASSSSSNGKNKRRPYTNNKNRKVLPSKFVKPQLEEVTAEVTSVDDTHVVYKTKVTTEAPEMKSTGVTDYYDRFTTRKPLWPYQMPTRRVPTKRPPAFSRVTAKPKHPYANKKPQGSSIYSMTSPTTTTPSTTTTYIRNPQTSIITPMTGLTVSLADIPFMDFLRSQIIPRIGLTLISFMASTPLLLSLLGAGLRRRKRSLEPEAQFSSFSGRALFEDTKRRSSLHQGEQFDFSTIQKKLEDALMKYPSRRRVGHSGAQPATNSFDMITEAFKQLARWWTTKSSPALSRTSDNGGKKFERYT